MESIFISDAAKLKENINVMYVGKSSSLIKGEQLYIAPDNAVCPYVIDGINMIPVKFFAKTIGGEVFSEFETEVKIASGALEAVFSADDSICMVDGREEKLKRKAEIGKGGVLYAPSVDLCRIFSKFLHEEMNGLIIYSDKDISASLDWVNNTAAMRNISESFMFDDVSGKELHNLIVKNHPNKSHPRLIFTEEKFAKIRKELESADGDPVYKKIFSHLKDAADRFLNEEPSFYELRDGIRLLFVCEENSERMMVLSLVYNLTGDEKYARRAYKEMEVSAQFSDWNPYHFLDVGEMATGMALAYDWLYNWMTPEQRKLIREAIVTKAIYPIIEDFDDVPRERSWNWRGELADNWRLIIGGVGVAAMAIVDELSGKDLADAERTMEQTLYDIRRALSLWAPYGAYEEGVGYWGYGMQYFAYIIKSLETAAGNLFGYLDVTGMKLTNNYIFAMNGSVSTFDYHDGEAGDSAIDPETMLIAGYFGNYGDAKARINKIMNEKIRAHDAVSDMFLYMPEFLSADSAQNALDTYLPIAEVATMRSGYDKEDIWLGLHCDDPIGGEGHDHMDSGSFVLDAMGENFFFDLGKDDYTLPNYLHSYRVRDEGHNVVIFNPDSDYSMKFGGRAYIKKAASKEDGGFAIGELSQAYRDEFGVISYRRGAKLASKRRVATIQDEIRLTSSVADLYWFAHTRADIEILSGGRSAVLTQNGKKLLATIVKGEGKFSVMNAEPMASSPKIEGQNPNTGIKKLTVHMQNVKDIDLCVTFVSADEDIKNFEFLPLSQW